MNTQTRPLRSRKAMPHRRLLALAIAASLAAGSVDVAQARPFPAVINLGSLDGSNGFRLDGVAADDRAGRSVSAAGDINGDGLDDLIVGAFLADPNGNKSAGSSYVVFGSSGPFAATLALSALDGSNGFRLDGAVAGDQSGFSVSAAGDINGDGIDDLIIGASSADPDGNFYAGSSYVLFGSTSPFAATLALSALDGNNGFRLDGEVTNDYSGRAVSAAGDINGDGIDDLIVGTYRSGLAGGMRFGSSYVVFGSTTAFAAALTLSSLNGSTGFRIEGTALGDYLGSSVSAAGDINGDGVDDLILGAFYANANGNERSGYSYVVFGRTSPFAPTLALSSLDGNIGFRLDGTEREDYAGKSVSGAGDINGDGIDDVIIGAEGADFIDTQEAGSTYVVFGRTTAFAATIALSSLDGSNGVQIGGVSLNDYSGFSVSVAGDINNDGIDDLIIGARRADPNGNTNAGSSYVVFGRTAPFAATFALSTLDGNNGFRLDGAAANDFSGHSVSAAGDINGDGIDDLIIGASGADPNGVVDAGSSFVVFGRDVVFADGFE